jgi:hypothetical protein
MSRPKSAKTVSTPATTTTPKQRGRIPAKLNITEKVGVGMSYVLRRLSDNVLVRAASACQRDKINPESKMFGKPICKYSGTKPFFTLKLNASKVGVKYLTMLCSPTLPFCEDVKNEYRYEGVSLKDALAKGLTVDQSGFYVSSETATPKIVKVKKEKVVKVAKVRKAKASKKKAKVIPAAETSTPADAPTVLYSNTDADEDVNATTTAIVENAVDTPVVKKEETMADFEKECDAEFEADIQKINAAKAQS